MRVKFSHLIVFLSCIFVIGIFWYLKDTRGIVLSQSKLCSNIEPLKEKEVSQGALGLQEAFVNVAERIKPAVVNISTVHMVEYPQQEFYFGDPFEDFFNDFFGNPRRGTPRRPSRKYKQEGSGSGVIITQDGYVLTNEHVIRDADEIKVTVRIDGKDRVYDGKVVGKDQRTDIAVVKIKSNTKFPAAPLGDSDKVQVGQWVIAIGSPFGLEQTVTSGIVSAIRQSIVVENKRYNDFIQTDAAINRGNSGGPLCSIYGEVVAINTAIFAPTGGFIGIGFSIPINSAKRILDDLIQKGKVVRGWLGVEIRDVDNAIQKQFKLTDKKGAMINNIIDNSPAQKSGFKRGDIIIEFGGKQVESTRSLQDIVSGTSPKKKVKVGIIRDGKQVTLDLVTGEMPAETESLSSETREKQRESEDTSTWEGMKVMNLSSTLSERYNIKGEKGVVVIEVGPQGQAGEIGIQEGDLIKSINRIEVTDMESFDRIMKKVKLSEGIVFDVVRQGHPIFLSYSSEE